MKMTRDNGTWSPEFWQASGSLGIDLNGLDISGTVDAAYYRAGTAVPGSVLTLPDIGSSNEIDASTGTDIDATSDTDTDTGTGTDTDTSDAEIVESNSEAALSRETDTETTASDQASENEEIIADQTTEEIASNEAFDVDTIFTSGTFEIAAGGGNPDDSIFQGEVELAQMKMTRDNDTWSPEFWVASGSLGIDLNGLDISGTVDAAYYRAGTAVPGSVLTLPGIGSSNQPDASTGTDTDATSDTGTDSGH